MRVWCVLAPILPVAVAVRMHMFPVTFVHTHTTNMGFFKCRIFRPKSNETQSLRRIAPLALIMNDFSVHCATNSLVKLWKFRIFRRMCAEQHTHHLEIYTRKNYGWAGWPMVPSEEMARCVLSAIIPAMGCGLFHGWLRTRA